MRYRWPVYNTELTREKLLICRDMAFRLLEEVGFLLQNAKMMKGIKGKASAKVDGERVKFSRELITRNFDKILARQREELLRAKTAKAVHEWKVTTGGFSMMTIDVETDEIRPATCADLKNLIKLMDFYGIEGSYPVMPQDLPPIMQAIACFKICWETSDKVRPFDYQHISQTDYIYEMHRVIGKTFTIVMNVVQPMTLSAEDINVFLKFYPEWEKGADINFLIANYPMLGINKPVSATGCVTQYLAESLAIYTLFILFDPALEMPVQVSCGLPTDLRSVCWAFGHPSRHLFRFLNSRLWPILCEVEEEEYSAGSVLLETSSSSIDAQAALEKTATALTAALQGARHFSYVGSLAVDDIFSGVQMVIDMEIVEYIKQVVGAFNPHPDITSTDGIFELLFDVFSGKESFLSHPDTAQKFRNILPSSNPLYREKLRQWLSHKKTFKDRAREKCIRILKEHSPSFRLPSEKQKALDEIYIRPKKPSYNGKSLLNP